MSASVMKIFYPGWKLTRGSYFNIKCWTEGAFLTKICKILPRSFFNRLMIFCLFRWKLALLSIDPSQKHRNSVFLCTWPWPLSVWTYLYIKKYLQHNTINAIMYIKMYSVTDNLPIAVFSVGAIYQFRDYHNSVYDKMFKGFTSLCH